VLLNRPIKLKVPPELAALFWLIDFLTEGLDSYWNDSDTTQKYYRNKDRCDILDQDISP